MWLERARDAFLAQLNREISDKRVIEAIMQVPRERFVPVDLYSAAYDDRPLTIGYGQTISQPLIVALMTQALGLHGEERVLEIGTGSGYQTAILSLLAKHVVSTERISQLRESAHHVQDELGYRNIYLVEAGKKLGWEEGSPYDAIIVTAAAPRVPDSLLKQLVIGGRLVMPVGSRWEQELVKVTKEIEKDKIEYLGGCRFVPLIGEDAWPERGFS
ncbi:MAG TPA: protein-L-isoaspartate O-methyltransferase [Dehalococcoidia bacterium]|nr:protein-L-isoaspartate O-methyltransferase [Dehalococcoidia bacterium]